jgi:hypothetical protein
MKNIFAILSIAMLFCIALTPTASASDIDNSNTIVAVDIAPDISMDAVDNSTIGTPDLETFEDIALNLESTIGITNGNIGNKGRTPSRKARQYKRKNGRKANASSWSFPNQPRSQKPTRCAAYN